MKKFLFLALFLLSTTDIFAAGIEEPQNLDKRHWLYFGWEEDHPKAISLMGGGVYARRPRTGRDDGISYRYAKEAWNKNSDKGVFFLIGVDGGELYYPNEKSKDRKETIKWHLAEGYLPFPVSKWQHNNIEVEITHFGKRHLDNIINVVYSQVRIKNLDKTSHKVKLAVQGEGVAERVFPLKKTELTDKADNQLDIDTELAPGKEAVCQFVLPANGTAALKSIMAMGSFEKNYAAEKARILSRMEKLTNPVALPDHRFIELWKSSMTNMWNATVQAYDELEQHGSGGNLSVYQYDRVFNHDVPDMVVQYILEGNTDFARRIMSGSTYEALSEGLVMNLYLDAVPKYIISLAQYLQITGDKGYFTEELLGKLKRCSRAIRGLRQFDEITKKDGLYGLLKNSSTLDNGARTHLIVDNFAALHGYAAYIYICKRFNLTDEQAWAEQEMQDLNTCLNNAIDKSLEFSGNDWYNACFAFDDDPFLTSGPGNWLGTTFMMPTFPWNAWLKGFNLGGTWADHLDRSVERWFQKGRESGCPEGSVGAWWGAKYGSVYNAGMVMPLLYSEKHRTFIPQSIAWLLDNQTAPFQWGESFRKSGNNDWTFPAADFETWGLGFIRQAMLQMCVSLHVDGTVILGRGIPDEWVNSGKPIAWKNIRINDGKQMDFLSFQKFGNRLDVLMKGDKPEGNIVLNLPAMRSNIDKVEVKGGEVVSTDKEMGKVTVTGKTTMISVYINK